MRKIIQMALRLKKSEKGFALIAAIMACMLLLALGMLVISLSTQDMRVSVRIVGDKRALAAAEEGIHSLFQANVDPHNNPVIAPQTITRPDIGGGVSQYTINYPATNRPPYYLPRAGFSIGGGVIWVDAIHNVSVTGRSTEYTTQVTISVGLGYGPVDLTTIYQ